jgi:hypothetical protein
MGSETKIETAPRHSAGAFLFGKDKSVESVRQMLSAMYVALTEAAGGDVLRDANPILKDAIDCGAVDDIYARSALLTWSR